MSLKRTPADAWFSKCVRIRTDWTCEYCKLNYAHDPAYLHCSHFISRAYNIIRYDPRNAFAHCHACHERLGGGRWGGGNIAEFVYHYEEVHGRENIDLMRMLSKHPFPKHKKYIKDISTHYRNEFRRMEELRNNGFTDRLEFENYMCAEKTILENKLIGDINYEQCG